MADVTKAWQFVLSNEDTVPPTGKVIIDNNGASTRLGINSRWHREALADGFFTMDLESALDYAEDIFKYDYWSMILGYQIESQIVASKFSDLAFNCSPKAAVTILQLAINSLRSDANTHLASDGCCGALTIAAVNTYLDDADVEALYSAILEQGAAYYESLDPAKFPSTLKDSWLKRLNKRPES